MATYTLISSNVLSSNTSTITFSSIPATYTDLVIRCSVRSDRANAIDLMGVTLNNNTAAIASMVGGNGNGTSVSGDSLTDDTYTYYNRTTANTATSNTFSSHELYFTSYVASRSKTYSVWNAQENNSATGWTGFNANQFRSNNAITTITLTNLIGTNFLAGSSFYLYGVFNGPETLPSTPTIGTATADNASASITFTPTSSAGVDASYTALSTPGSLTGTSASSPITVSGLTNGTAYTFQVKANNPGGSSAYSAASNSVTPQAPAYELIATATGTTAASVTFNSIPQTYSHLELRAVMRDTYTGANGSDNLRVWPNSTGASVMNVQGIYTTGTGNTLSNYEQTSGQYLYVFGCVPYGTGIYDMGNVILTFYNYSQTNHGKTYLVTAGSCSVSGNLSNGYTTTYQGGTWNGSATISSLVLSSPINGFTTSTIFYLYGIK